MGELMIFRGIEGEELAQMLACFQAKEVSFAAEETVMEYRSNPSQIGLLMEGEARLVRYDYDGNCAILERLEKNSVFGELFALPMIEDNLQIRCSKDCRVLFIDYRRMMTRCRNNCRRHDVFLANLLELVARKVQQLNARVEVLSQRSIRGKLLTYFEILARQAGSRSFAIPFSMSSLADYLCVDRSAMLREMKKLREEQLLSSAGRQVTLL